MNIAVNPTIQTHAIASIAHEEPTCFMLMGLPCSGKTLWRQTLFNAAMQNRHYVSVNFDDLVQDVADEVGVSYMDAWREVDHRVVCEAMFDIFDQAVVRKQTVVVDRANLTEHSRDNFLSALPGIYHRVGVVFRASLDTLLERNAERARAGGKEIPEADLIALHARCEHPVQDAEFDKIFYINQS